MGVIIVIWGITRIVRDYYIEKDFFNAAAKGTLKYTGTGFEAAAKGTLKCTGTKKYTSAGRGRLFFGGEAFFWGGGCF